MKENEIRAGLYVVATPIGNLEDLSPRALRVLKNMDWIAAEDTRHSLRLCNEFGIEKPLYSLHEHSTPQKIQELVDRLRSGETAAYVSDAGTPAVSDPGSKLVRAAQEAGIYISPIPGPSAITALLSVAGIDATGFRFHGFFPREKKEREQVYVRMISEAGAHIFYESPFRVKEVLQFLAHKNSNLRMIVGRELTKKFETLYVGTAEEVASSFAAMEEVKGEIVCVLEFPENDKDELKTARKKPQDLLGDFQKMAALGANQKLLLAVAESHGLKRSEVYDLILEVLQKKGGQP